MKRVTVLAGLIVFALLIPVLLMGVLLSISGERTSPSKKALEEIPPKLIGTYQAAAATCHGLDWTILAAVHKTETGFGTGRATSSAGAQGPMQFMPATFESYGTDGDGDGVADINDVEDAIFSAAALLCANGAGDPARLADALWQYNHSDAYVNDVLTLAASYGVESLPPGSAFAAGSNVLFNPRITLSSNARADVQAGLIDSRLLTLLDLLSQRHTFTVSVLKTGHSKYTRSGSVSLHYYGRAADIPLVDGRPVSRSHAPARQVVVFLASLRGQVRPDEVGHPFVGLEFSGGFTDADHDTHIHIGLTAEKTFALCA